MSPQGLPVLRLAPPWKGCRNRPDFCRFLTGLVILLQLRRASLGPFKVCGWFSKSHTAQCKGLIPGQVQRGIFTRPGWISLEPWGPAAISPEQTTPQEGKLKLPESLPLWDPWTNSQPLTHRRPGPSTQSSDPSCFGPQITARSCPPLPGLGTPVLCPSPQPRPGHTLRMTFSQPSRVFPEIDISLCFCSQGAILFLRTCHQEQH